MDIADIAMLEAIVRHGSINKASEVLHVTQPTLSKRLSRLEHTLGTSLFLRSSSGLTPTPHTRFIIERAQPIKTMIANIERHIELANTLETGTLSIGIGPIIEQLYFPHALHALTQSETSTLNLSIRTESAEDLARLLVEGVIDIAIGPFEHRDDDAPFTVHPIARQPLVYAARRKHPLVAQHESGQSVPREDFTEYPLNAPHAPRYIADQAEVHGQFDDARILCDNYAIIRDFIKRSDHLTAGPISVFSQDVKDCALALIPFVKPIDWHASCITRPESETLPVIEKVIEVFAAHELPSLD